MPDTEKQMQNSSVLSLKINIVFIAVFINGGLLFFLPLECPHCKHKMEFLELYYNHKRVSLEELYEKAMSKFLGKRSSS